MIINNKEGKMKEYRIAWRSKTNNELNGDDKFSSKEISKEEINRLNKNHPNINHWIETLNF